jgi:hypothetical protein
MEQPTTAPSKSQGHYTELLFTLYSKQPYFPPIHICVHIGYLYKVISLFFYTFQQYINALGYLKNLQQAA